MVYGDELQLWLTLVSDEDANNPNVVNTMPESNPSWGFYDAYRNTIIMFIAYYPLWFVNGITYGIGFTTLGKFKGVW